MFGKDRFGITPFGTASFTDFYWDHIPNYYRENDDGTLEKFLYVIGYSSDEIKFYAERIWWLYDAFKGRKDLLVKLAHNFGIEVSDYWSVDFLRRFIDYIGKFVKQKGVVQAIKNVIVMLGFSEDCKVWELYEMSKLPGDITEHPEIFVIRFGENVVYGKNKFLHGEWKYCYSAVGWFSKEQFTGVPEGPVNVNAEIQVPTPPFNGVEKSFTGSVQNFPVYERCAIFVLKNINGEIKEKVFDVGINPFTMKNLRSINGSTGYLNYNSGEWTIIFKTAPEATDILEVNYTYGKREIYPVSLLRFGMNANLTEEQLKIIKSICKICVPNHVGVVNLITIGG